MLGSLWKSEGIDVFMKRFNSSVYSNSFIKAKFILVKYFWVDLELLYLIEKINHTFEWSYQQCLSGAKAKA